jgi:hypothetical protein
MTARGEAMMMLMPTHEKAKPLCDAHAAMMNDV